MLGVATVPSTTAASEAAAAKADHDALLREYYEIARLVGECDGRLMTVKGWGVTLSLAALGLGFQEKHFGLFLVAALSGVGFWLIEGALKRHQMRHYLRMREIEVLRYRLAEQSHAGAFSSPRIDWSWWIADRLWLYTGARKDVPPPASLSGPRWSYRLAWFFPHVFLPHVITVLAGLVLFSMGLNGRLGDMGW